VHVLLEAFCLTGAAAALKPRVTGVADNFQQPATGISAAATVELIEGFERAQIRFLDDVLGIVLAAHQPAGQIESGVEVWQDGLLKPAG
jgi:hypothetical protein